MKQICSVVMIGLLYAFLPGCSEKPGPISVDNDISPAVVNSFGYINWKVSVTNAGGKVEIERIHCKEECISGWMEGQSAELDVPISNSEVAAHRTEVVHAQTSPVINTGPDDIQMKNTVTVYSNGGTDSDDAYYTIKCYKGSKSTPSAARTLVFSNVDK